MNELFDATSGSAKKVSLALARERAPEVRTWMEQGLDPVFEKRKAAGIPTFREATAKVLALNKKTWCNENQRAHCGRQIASRDDSW